MEHSAHFLCTLRSGVGAQRGAGLEVSGHTGATAPDSTSDRTSATHTPPLDRVDTNRRCVGVVIPRSTREAMSLASQLSSDDRTRVGGRIADIEELLFVLIHVKPKVLVLDLFSAEKRDLADVIGVLLA